MVNMRQVGSIYPNVAAILVTITLLAWIGLESIVTEGQRGSLSLVDGYRAQAMERINALNACYNDTRSWCDVNSMAEYGVTSVNAANSLFVSQVPQGEDLLLTVQVPTEVMARAFSRFVVNPVVNGNQVTFLVEPPTRSHYLVDSIQRWQDNEFNRNRLEQSIDMAGNDVPNINEAEAVTGRFDSIESRALETQTFNVTERLLLGPNAIEDNGSQLSFVSDSLAMNGDLYSRNDVSLNGNDIRGIENISSAVLGVQSLRSERGNLTRSSGRSVNYQNSRFGDVESNSMTTNSMMARSLVSESIDVSALGSDVRANSATITELSFTQGQGTSWLLGNVQTNSLSSDSSIIGIATGQRLSLTGFIDGISIVSGSGQIGEADVRGTYSGADFYAQEDFFTDTSSVNTNFNRLGINGGLIKSHGSLIEKSKSDIAIAQGISNDNRDRIAVNRGDILRNSNQIDVNQSESDINYQAIAQSKRNIESANVLSSANERERQNNSNNIASNATSIGVNAFNISGNNNDVAQTGDMISDAFDLVGQNSQRVTSNRSLIATNTTRISSNRTALDTNSASILDTQDRVSLAFDNARNNSSQIVVNRDAIASNRNTMSNNAVLINQNEGNISSVRLDLNDAADELGLWQERLDDCMYDTMYCIPQDPSANITCSDCEQSAMRTDFTATVSGVVSQCRQGCNYSWVVTGDISVSSGCTSGVVGQSGSASVSCVVVKRGLTAQQRATGQVSLVVQNAHYGARSASDVIATDFFNSTPLGDRPSVRTSCSDCYQVASQSSFSSTTYATVGNCLQGCSYTWSRNAGGQVCSSGTLPPGNEAHFLTCEVTGTLQAGEVERNGVTIRVTNSQYPTILVNSSQTIYWENSSQLDPFSDLLSGCSIFTTYQTPVSESFCAQTIPVGGFSGRGTVIFSVGDRLSADGTRYEFSNPADWQIFFQPNAATCSGLGLTCSQTIFVNSSLQGYRIYNARPQITHIPTGRTLSYDTNPQAVIVVQ
ncbi:hypothetical protein KUL42_39030 [Alteromonas sp. KUL42]|uniref:hypothetical protein n=1 Tax=Alteromonas sp. KUL42 TaxID=2480797 RepID=UPI001035DFA9|nr:hypothetical protein [Alteromonas sp. KUL42]TAP31709.1 hypothetical protein EYR97_19670 [Alteromonas sp. KUL42]GEA09142.1 hypothetical protein KUL42_39030 [Alteromonas sp. KUL42]